MGKEKEYCEYLKEKIEELENEFVEEKNELYEFYGGCTESYDLDVERAWDRMKEQLHWWFITAKERNVNKELLKEIFSDYYWYEKWEAEWEEDY